MKTLSKTLLMTLSLIAGIATQKNALGNESPLSGSTIILIKEFAHEGDVEELKEKQRKEEEIIKNRKNERNPNDTIFLDSKDYNKIFGEGNGS
jgi:hypothetical protein